MPYYCNPFISKDVDLSCFVIQTTNPSNFILLCRSILFLSLEFLLFFCHTNLSYFCHRISLTFCHAKLKGSIFTAFYAIFSTLYLYFLFVFWIIRTTVCNFFHQDVKALKKLVLHNPVSICWKCFKSFLWRKN